MRRVSRVQAVHDRSRCVFALGAFTPFADGIAATVKWASEDNNFDPQEYAAHVAADGDGTDDLPEGLDGDAVQDGVQGDGGDDLQAHPQTKRRWGFVGDSGQGVAERVLGKGR